MADGSVIDIKAQPLYRIQTDLSEIDWMYGYTRWGPGNVRWGLPVGKISLWAGEKGVGKSRATIEVAKSVAQVKNESGQHYPVVYFCLEEEIESFADNAKRDGTILPRHFYASNERNVEKQIEIIRKYIGQVIFIDSINQVEGYSENSSSRVKKVIELYRKIAVERNAHIILISMLNANGDTKGSTTLPHLVDNEFSVKRSDEQGEFEVRVGKKHRGGRTGDEFYSVWRHCENNAEIISANRTKDKIWADSHGHQVFDINDLARKAVENARAEENRKKGFLSKVFSLGG